MRLAVLHFFVHWFRHPLPVLHVHKVRGEIRCCAVWDSPPAVFRAWLPKKEEGDIGFATSSEPEKVPKMEVARIMWNFVLPLLFLWSIPIGKLRELIKNL